MNSKISIFLILLILFMGCGDDEDSLSNDIDFHSNHAGSIWYTPADNGGYWLRINNDSSDDYWNGTCRSCLLYTSPSPRDRSVSRMPSSA